MAKGEVQDEEESRKSEGEASREALVGPIVLLFG